MGVKELTLSANIYGGANGNFGLLDFRNTWPPAVDRIKWYSCREEFANAANDSKNWVMVQGGFLFSHHKEADDIAEFISKFEALLEAGRRKPLQRSLVQRVSSKNPTTLNLNSLVWVVPGPFWLRQTMRFSLFTMLFRCANFGYKAGQGGDFFSALFTSYNLAMGTKSSIGRFLDGYTWYKGKNDGRSNGWYNTFHTFESYTGNQDVWKVLVRPQPKKLAPSEDAILKTTS